VLGDDGSEGVTASHDEDQRRYLTSSMREPKI